MLYNQIKLNYFDYGKQKNYRNCFGFGLAAGGGLVWNHYQNKSEYQEEAWPIGQQEEDYFDSHSK